MNKSIRTLLIIGALLLATALVWKFIVSDSKPSKPQNSPAVVNLPEGEVVAEIMMKEDSYEPNTVTIKAGQAIRFVNSSSDDRWPASNIHPTHDLYPEFDPKKHIKPGESWTFTFRKQGMWRMHDHLASYIKGTVTVE